LTVAVDVALRQENDAWAALLAEISAEAGQVAQFLIDREIEAPERYSAVQSYRVAMAVLRQQRLFVEVRGVVLVFLPLLVECWCWAALVIKSAAV
jgi:hypothetical protein